jgi:hypothetical protein
MGPKSGYYSRILQVFEDGIPGKKANKGQNFVENNFFLEGFDFKTRCMGEFGHFNPC